MDLAIDEYTKCVLHSEKMMRPYLKEDFKPALPVTDVSGLIDQRPRSRRLPHVCGKISRKILLESVLCPVARVDSGY